MGKPQMNIARYYFYRHITDPLALRLSRTRITPNQISTVGIFFGLLAGAFVAQGSTPYRLIGILLWYQLARMCDWMDGDVARIKKMQSAFGAWYDNVAERVVDFAIMFGVSYNAYTTTSEPLYLLLGMLAVFNITMVGTLSQIKEYLPKRTSFSQLGKHTYIGRSTFTVILLPVLVILGLSTWAVIFFASVGMLMWMYQIAKHYPLLSDDKPQRKKD